MMEVALKIRIRVSDIARVLETLVNPLWRFVGGEDEQGNQDQAQQQSVKVLT